MGVLVDITTRCNMTCGHCMWSRTQDGQDMTEEVFRAALNMKPVRGYGTFSFGSGEPTVHPDFWRFIEIALEDTRWKVRVVTNGKLTETALAVAALGKQGFIEAHLSLDKWHDPIDPIVVEAFKRDPAIKGDKRAYRFCEDDDLKNIGRCDFAKDKRPSCRCPVPKITHDGKVFFCGCEGATSIGHVLTGWNRKLLREPWKLNCERYLPNADKNAPKKFFRGLQILLRKGRDKDEIPKTRRQKMETIIDRIRPTFEKYGEFRVMGSYARGAEEPRDIDILLVSEQEPDVKAMIVEVGGYRARTHQFRTTFEIDGIKVEVFPAKPEHLGASLLYLEGPGTRNVGLRKKASAKGLTWKFKGLFAADGSLLPSGDRDTVLASILNEEVK